MPMEWDLNMDTSSSLEFVCELQSMGQEAPRDGAHEFGLLKNDQKVDKNTKVNKNLQLQVSSILAARICDRFCVV